MLVRRGGDEVGGPIYPTLSRMSALTAVVLFVGLVGCAAEGDAANDEVSSTTTERVTTTRRSTTTTRPTTTTTSPTTTTTKAVVFSFPAVAAFTRFPQIAKLCRA